MAAITNYFRRPSPTAVLSGLALLSALAWFAGGCASSSRSSSAPKPGKGIAEYREVVSDAHRSVAAVVDLLEALSRSITPSSTPSPPGLARFDRAFHELELTSIKARAKAEAIIARGQTYFDEWKGNLSGITNRATALAETERYDRLVEHFETIRNRSGDVREGFRPFMAKLREFRARLDKPATAAAAGGETVAEQLLTLTTSGQRVLQTLDSVSTALDEAEVEARASLKR